MLSSFPVKSILDLNWIRRCEQGSDGEQVMVSFHWEVCPNHLKSCTRNVLSDPCKLSVVGSNAEECQVWLNHGPAAVCCLAAVCGTDGEFWLQRRSKEALSVAQMSHLVFGTNYPGSLSKPRPFGLSGSLTIDHGGRPTGSICQSFASQLYFCFFSNKPFFWSQNMFSMISLQHDGKT